MYNRSVTNVNVTVVHNVYERNVVVNQSERVSYNGGPRGINARPEPAEMAALRETHTRPVAAQVEHVRAAESNRQQFASVNRGRPVQIAQAQPLATPIVLPPRGQPRRSSSGRFRSRPLRGPRSRTPSLGRVSRLS